MLNIKITFITIALLMTCLVFGCSGSGKEGLSPNVTGYPDTPLTIHDEADLIGGPVAQGRIGDVLIKNDRIRVIIQKPAKNPTVNSFGGNIIDADLVRPQGQAGEDNFGSIFPLVNVEWTVNYQNYEVLSDSSDGGAKILRAYGVIDVYDYLDLDFIGEVAEGIAGQSITFSNRFDDRRNPFEIYDDLKGMDREVVTDYTLEPDKNYVRIDTTFKNNGDDEVSMPVGQFINGSGQVSMLIPGLGFSPDLMTEVGGGSPAVIYAGFDDVDVSYGYFYKSSQFKDPDGEIYKTTSVSYSGLTGLLFGEEFLKIAPLGKGGTPEIHFSIPPKSSRTITGYFVVGNGSAGSVFDAGLAAIGAKTRPITGSVVDAGGSPVEGALVAVMSKSNTLITYRTDSSGAFSGNLPTGGNAESARFGNGKYKVLVEMPGFHKNGTVEAGECDPSEIDLMTKESAQVTCTLGETGTVNLAGPVIDSETQSAITTRLTIVGTDPSPNKVGSAGRFRSTYHWEFPFGIVDVKYITAKGTIDLTGSTSFNIEPGTYLFMISHGPEYSTYQEVLDVPAGESVSLGSIALKRAVPTPGYVNADFHIHSITSPDSNFSQELRVLSVAAEGLDVLQSSDHDYITDYAPALSSLVSQGLIPAGSMQTSAGDEVTPNHYGHLHAFPLLPDPLDPAGGAVDWSNSSLDVVGPDPDYCPTLDELIDTLRDDPGEEVIQINHIMDNPTGLLIATGWVTSPFYLNDFGVPPLSSYADPVERRMPPRSSGTSFPLPFGTSALMSTKFNALELTIGLHLHDNDMLYRSALPTWFNLLNLGFIITATADSDSHRGIANPVGLPRNFIANSVDPRDGMGQSHDAIDLEEYAANINAGRLTISAGPYISISAKDEAGTTAKVGDVLTGRKASFTVNVSAPSWAWFDTVYVYANTEPIPVDDVTDMPMQGTAADPATFYEPYHMPRYTYQPSKTFKLSDGTLADWKEEDGVITASVSFDMEVDEDTWVVVMARGTRSTEGYRSLFPIVTNVLADPTDTPETFDPADLASFHTDSKVGASAWALTNPIFIDVNGDGFTAKYVKSGISPLAQ
ncbi:MAG: hypothetical protein ABH871_01245 [Pseudomonadota bacterium]